ncbi:MAG: DNA polymerase III subunit gamma/tau [Phycisphaerales bacterium]
MSYTALARRYRSRQFDEVVGQEPIARTLQNAIARGRVGHAYLFTGSRGVGKTTMARLFAKALNAPGDRPQDVADAIMQGRDTDVIEIDAASNRGVDEARDLIASCVYRPMRGEFKIYIIDEVHMLTIAAFNALLKTMEEPPSHVKFILCTTDAHKVPATIQSRCQRFDFRNIPTKRIAEHLAEVVKKEGLKAEASVVMSVARLGQGSMRDALSILDRLLASGEKSITSKLLEEMLGLADRELVDGLLEAAADGDAPGALTRAEELLTRGVSVDQLLEALLERLRDVLVLSACGGETELVEAEGEDLERAQGLAGGLDPGACTHMIALCENVRWRAKASSSPRALLDAMLVRLAMTERLSALAAMVESGEGEGAQVEVKGGVRGGGVSKESPPKKAEAAPGAPAETPTPEIRPESGGDAGAAPCARSGSVEDVWQAVRAGAVTGRGRAMLGELRLTGFDGEVARVSVASRHTMLYLEEKQRGWLEELFARACRKPVRVEMRLEEGVEEQEVGEAPDPRAAALRIGLVREAVELFDARIVSASVMEEEAADVEDEESPAQGGGEAREAEADA